MSDEMKSVGTEKLMAEKEGGLKRFIRGAA
jgi:hypothetical protein